MIEHKHWVEGHCVEHSAHRLWAECLTRFPVLGLHGKPTKGSRYLRSVLAQMAWVLETARKYRINISQFSPLTAFLKNQVPKISSPSVF